MIETFTSGTTTYIYDKTLINTQQMVSAEEILRFRYEQDERKPETWDAVEKSGSLEWFVNCTSALLRKVDNEKPVEFNNISWGHAKAFVKSLNFMEHTRLKACLKDFFCTIQQEGMITSVFAIKSSKQIDKITSQIVEMLVKEKTGEKPISTKPKKR